MKKIPFNIIFCLSFIFLNCQTQKLYFVDKVAVVPSKTAKTEHYFFGLGGSSLIDAKKLCGDKKVGMITSKTTGMDAFLSIVTIGIYTPRHYFVHCVN